MGTTLSTPQAWQAAQPVAPRFRNARRGGSLVASDAPLFTGTRPMIAPGEIEETATSLASQGPWRVVVLNDPVNSMSYVVLVFRRVFGFAESRARRHMLEVHEQGRSVVWSGLREQAELYAFALQQWHLTAILENDETN